jgi:hypothetical protein
VGDSPFDILNLSKYLFYYGTDRKGKPMESDKKGLSEKQEMALELAVTGMTDVEIARQVG